MLSALKDSIPSLSMQHISSTSSISCSSHRSIEHVCQTLKMPLEAAQAFKAKGLDNLYLWQMECLLKTSVTQGKNLIYSAPTSGGKGLVADLMSLRHVMANQHDLNNKVMIVLPFVSLVSEKERQMKALVKRYNSSQEKEARIRVKAFYGNFAESLRDPKTFRGKMIIICTIEKSSFLFNALLLSDRIDQLKLVVIDELHLLHDPSRGYMLEILVGKIKVVEAQAKYIREKRPKRVKVKLREVSIQMIALSATIGNIDVLASWLNAELYTTDFRPVPLQEYIKCGNEILTNGGNTFEILKEPSKDDPDHLVHITHHGLRRGLQTLVFCASRVQCEVVCKMFTKSLPILCCSSGLWKAEEGQSDAELGQGIAHYLEGVNTPNCQYLLQERMSIASQLFTSNEDEKHHILKDGIQVGVAYHHAGLSDKERHVLERSFKSGLISVLVATSTLAAGVNLPAGRVIIKGMSIGTEYLGCVQYRQMIGRAGRAGHTTYGDSFLLVRNADRDRALSLSQRPIPDVKSQITPSVDGGRSLLKAILEQFNLGLSQSSLDVEMHVKHTLMYAECINEMQRNEVLAKASQCLQFLLSSNAIEPKITTENEPPQHMNQPTSSSVLFGDFKVPLALSRYGKAVCESNLKPDEAVVIYEELRRAQEMLNLETSLHLIYLIAPLQHNLIPNFEALSKLADNAYSRKWPFFSILEMLGITRRHLDLWSHNPPSRKEIKDCTHKLKLSKVSTLSSQEDSSGKSNSSIDNNEMVLCRVKRLWVAIVLVEVFEGRKTLKDIAVNYGVSTGDIENLIQSTGILSSQIQRFCSEIGWTSMEAMIKTCREVNLKPTIETELKDLLEMSNKFMTRKVAQVLFENGIHDVRVLANSSPESTARILLLKLSFECHPFEQESKDEKSWNELLELSKILINSAKNHLSRPRGEEQPPHSLFPIVHSDEDYRWECLEHDSQFDPESPTFEYDSDVEFDDTPHDDEDQIGKLSGESQDGEDIDRHCFHLRQANPISRMMNTSATLMSSADISYVDEEDCHDYRGYMNPSSPNNNIGENTVDLELTTHIHEVSDRLSPAHTAELDLHSMTSSQHMDKHQSHHTYKTVEDFENDEVIGEEILKYVEEMEQQAALRQQNPQVSHVTPSSNNAPSNNRQLTKAELLKSALSPPPPNNSSPYISALSPSLCKGSPGQYLYLPKQNMIQNVTGNAYREGLENSLKIAADRAGFKYRSLYDAKAAKLFFEKLSKAACIAFEIVYRDLSKSVPTSSWASLTSYRSHRSAQSVCQGADVTLLQAYKMSSETRKEEKNVAKVIAGISFSFGDEAGFYLPLPTPLPLWSEIGSDSCACNQFIDGESGVSKSLEKQVVHIDQLPSSCKQLICRFVGYTSILGSTYDNFRKLRTSDSTQDDCSSNSKFDGEFFVTKCKERGENANAFFYHNSLLSTSKSWMINARKGLLHEWRKGRCIEWRLVNAIMSNEKLMKIAVNIKNQIVCLRERDVIVKGPLMDPSVGAKLLENAVPRKNLPFLPVLRIPRIHATQRGMFDEHIDIRLFKEIVGATFYTVSVYRTMARLERLLNGTSVGKVFHMVEMPLSISLAEAEYAGVPMNKKFFLDLRQNLLDRCRMIEYYFSVIHPSGQKVNLCSSRDVNGFIETLVEHYFTAGYGKNMSRCDYKDFVTRHLGKYVSEYRAHSLLQPLCTCILNDNVNRRREEELRRIKCTFNSIGTDTGRVIVSSPSLQTVPRECSYRRCVRPTLHDELMAAFTRNNDVRDLRDFIQKLNSKLMKTSKADIEWVRVSDKKRAIGGKAATFTIGQLRLVTQQPITKPGVKTSSWSPSARNQLALVDSWIDNGFTYSLDEAQKVFQVLVTFDAETSSKKYCYPADQVTRLQTYIKEDTEELNEILEGLKSSKFLQPQSKLSKVVMSPRDGITSSEKYVLLSADYSQIELRLLAHFSGDDKLISVFHDLCCEDIFLAIASKWHKKPAQMISEIERNNAKRICYAVIYGAGPKLVAMEQNCPLSEARRMMETFLKTYPGITRFITDVKKSTKEMGYIETMLGRRRAVDGITSLDETVRLKAERQAVNSVCQGSAADLIKLAMVNIFHQLDELTAEVFKQVRKVKSNPGGGLYRQQDIGLRFLLQIHDELLFEVKEDYVDVVSSVIKNCMENAVSLKVPLKVKIKTAKSWGELK